MVISHADHLLILVCIEIHEIVVCRIHMTATLQHLVVQVRTRRTPAVTRECNGLSALHTLTLLHIETLQMRIACLVAVAMVDNDHLSISALTTGLLHHTIGRSIHRCAYIAAEVHTLMEDTGLIDRMYTVAIS